VLRSEKQLKSDIDYIHTKLERLHPNLYWYITRQDLDFKFDSLKSSINAPMTSNEFYFQLSPVLSSVRQGHLRLFPLNKKIKIKESFSLLKSGTSPLSQFEFESFDNKLFVIKNNSVDSSIVAGTEVVAVNNLKPQELVSKYSRTFTSDGYNRTFTDRKSGKGLPTWFYYQNGITDSVFCQLKYNDSVRTVCLKRKSVKVVTKKKKTEEIITVKRDQNKKENKKRKESGFDELTKSYSKNLSFIEPDSSIAVLKIRDFSNGNYKKFYSNSFRQLDTLKTNTLILDLRDNPGGYLRDAMDLYSYLSDSDFVFIDRSEVVSRTSILHTNYFRGNPLFFNALLFAFSPIKLVAMGITLLKVKKEAGNKFYYPFPGSKPGHSKPDRFKGKLYVLINGGSFSATCLLSSNLKGSHRAVFVGEETGGAFNGTVAGKMPVFTLPESKLHVQFGLALIQPYYKTELEGRGIFPDIEIKPILEDRIKGKDLELQWVLEDINGRSRDR